MGLKTIKEKIDMKKKKLEKLKAKREAKRKQIKKRTEYIKKATNYEEADLVTMDPELAMMMHFPSGEFGCIHCVDYKIEICSGSGLTTYEECMGCICSTRLWAK
jgi:hypothetical protein